MESARREATARALGISIEIRLDWEYSSSSSPCLHGAALIRFAEPGQFTGSAISGPIGCSFTKSRNQYKVTQPALILVRAAVTRKQKNYWIQEKIKLLNDEYKCPDNQKYSWRVAPQHCPLPLLPGKTKVLLSKVKT